MPISVLMPAKKRTPAIKVSVYLDEDMKEDLEAVATAKGLSVSSLLKMLAAKEIRESVQEGIISSNS
ncbi:hypothetical protein I1H34_12440 [Acaryochloris marina S15]|nr:hypothetical protein I1H34_12440 [Acaryochloris marina S15]